MCPVWELSGLACVIQNDLHFDCCLVPPGGGYLTYLCRVMDVSESCGLQLLRTVAVILGISQLVDANFVFLIWGNSTGRVLAENVETHLLSGIFLLRPPCLSYCP